MKQGCLSNLLFGCLLFVAFGFSTYFWFNFFVRGRSLPTPNLIGKSVTEARAICSDAGVVVEVGDHVRNSDKVPAGYVAWQNRESGATSFIKRGARLKIELSAGPLVIRVPDLDAQSQRTALLRLGQQNLKMGNLTYVDEASPKEGIIATEPPNGTVVAAQTPVSLLVNVPATSRTYVMPDLIDHALDSVRPGLEANGLHVATVKFEAYPGIANGIIIRQFPLRGAPVSGRDAISLVVSKAEETNIIEQSAPPAQPVIQ
jgi:eukaryotic-like serine/threonine-protein kinase